MAKFKETIGKAYRNVESQVRQQASRELGVFGRASGNQGVGLRGRLSEGFKMAGANLLGLPYNTRRGGSGESPDQVFRAKKFGSSSTSGLVGATFQEIKPIRKMKSYSDPFLKQTRVTLIGSDFDRSLRKLGNTELRKPQNRVLKAVTEGLGAEFRTIDSELKRTKQSIVGLNRHIVSENNRMFNDFRTSLNMSLKRRFESLDRQQRLKDARLNAALENLQMGTFGAGGLGRGSAGNGTDSFLLGAGVAGAAGVGAAALAAATLKKAKDLVKKAVSKTSDVAKKVGTKVAPLVLKTVPHLLKVVPGVGATIFAYEIVMALKSLADIGLSSGETDTKTPVTREGLVSRIHAQNKDLAIELMKTWVEVRKNTNSDAEADRIFIQELAPLIADKFPDFDFSRYGITKQPSNVKTGIVSKSSSPKLPIPKLPIPKPAISSARTVSSRSQPSFDTLYNIQRTNEQKAEFLKYGKLPTGFEFLPGHMGRLGSAGAVSARGAMPLSGGYSGGGSQSSSSSSLSRARQSTPQMPLGLPPNVGAPTAQDPGLGRLSTGSETANRFQTANYDQGKSIERIGSLANVKRRESMQTDRRFSLSNNRYKSPFNWALSAEAAKEFGLRNQSKAEVTRNLVEVVAPNGKKVMMNKSVAADATEFLRELSERGYKIKTLGGFSYRRNVNNPSRLSTHSMGGTMDINAAWNRNQSSMTDMPDEIKDMAMLYGFAQLGNDKMHFERVSSAARRKYALDLMKREIIGKDHPQVQKLIQQKILKPDDIKQFKNFATSTAGPTGTTGPTGPKFSGSSTETKSSKERRTKISSSGKIDEQSFYKSAVAKVRNSKLNGFVPKDGAKFGITTGAPEQWARLYTMLLKQESGGRIASVGPDGRLIKFRSTPSGENSFGPLQFNIGEYGLKTWADVNDPDRNIDALIKVGERWTLKSGTIAGRGRGAGYYQGHGGYSAYFGSLRRPNETLQHSKWFAENINMRTSDSKVQMGTNQTPNIPTSSVAGDPRLQALRELERIRGGQPQTQPQAQQQSQQSAAQSTSTPKPMARFQTPSIERRAAKLEDPALAVLTRFRESSPNFEISSTYRSPTHPIEARKRRPGAHSRGIAFDISTRNKTSEELQIAVQNLIKSGVNYILLEGNPPHIHAEVRSNLNNPIIRNLRNGHPTLSLRDAIKAARGVKFNEFAEKPPTAATVKEQERKAEQKAIAQRGTSSFPPTSGKKPMQTGIIPAKPDLTQLNAMDELERAAALAGTDYTPPKRSEEIAEIESTPVKQPSTEYQASDLKRRWLGLDKMNLTPPPGIGPAPDLSKLQLDQASRLELKAEQQKSARLSAFAAPGIAPGISAPQETMPPMPVRVQPPPDFTGGLPSPGSPEALAAPYIAEEQERERVNAEREALDPDRDLVRAEAAKAEQGEKVPTPPGEGGAAAPGADGGPLFRNNPESSGAAPGTDGRGSYGRCFV